MVASFGFVLARPLLDLAGAIRHEMRRATWRELEGRHFAFRGRPVRVLDDDDHLSWVRLADVPAAIGFTAGDASLQLTYPSGCKRFGRPPEPYLSAEALLAHLAKERSTQAVRFARWVEREIAFPARRRREQFGIRPRPPDVSRDE